MDTREQAAGLPRVHGKRASPGWTTRQACLLWELSGRGVCAGRKWERSIPIKRGRGVRGPWSVTGSLSGLEVCISLGLKHAQPTPIRRADFVRGGPSRGGFFLRDGQFLNSSTSVLRAGWLHPYLQISRPISLSRKEAPGKCRVSTGLLCQERQTSGVLELSWNVSFRCMRPSPEKLGPVSTPPLTFGSNTFPSRGLACVRLRACP